MEFFHVTKFCNIQKQKRLSDRKFHSESLHGRFKSRLKTRNTYSDNTNTFETFSPVKCSHNQKERLWLESTYITGIMLRYYSHAGCYMVWKAGYCQTNWRGRLLKISWRDRTISEKVSRCVSKERELLNMMKVHQVQYMIHMSLEIRNIRYSRIFLERKWKANEVYNAGNCYVKRI